MGDEDAEQSVQRIGSLDALRGYAILGVLAVHCAEMSAPSAPWLMRFAQSGARGVQLFYVVSAFSIFLTLARHRVRGQASLLQYGISRVARIGPMFWLCFPLYWALGTWEPNMYAPSGVSAFDVGLAAIMMHTWWPTAVNSVTAGGWSIGVEACFYVFAPSMFVVLNGRLSSLVFVVLSCIACYPMCHAIEQAYAGTAPATLVNAFATTLSFPSQLPAFAFGIAVYAFYRRGSRIGPLLSATLIAVGLVLAIGVDRSHWFNVRGYDVLFVPMTINTAGVALVTLGVIAGKAGGLTSKWAQKLGLISFSVYMLQGAVLRVVYLIEKSTGLYAPSGNWWFLISFAVIGAVTVCLSLCTYRWVEKPAKRMLLEAFSQEAVSRHKAVRAASSA